MWPVVLLLLAPQASAPVTLERELVAMGTGFTVELSAPERELALAASEAAVRALEAAEARLSTWGETSELARLNRAPLGTWVELSPALEADLAAARALQVETGGAFDPGLAALVAAWGLRSGGRQPEAAELAAARAVGGLAGFEFAPARARRRVPLAGIEEGGFGKGLALDQALRAARAAGALDVWLDLGGQVRLELASEREVLLADPRERGRPVLAVRLSGGSLATSGNSERGILVNGAHRGHLLDPRTGEPAPDFGSLSVWAPDATRADGLSTGLYVLGPEAAGAHVAQHPELGLVVLEPRAGRLRARVAGVLVPRVRVLVDDLDLELPAAHRAASTPLSPPR